MDIVTTLSALRKRMTTQKVSYFLEAVPSSQGDDGAVATLVYSANGHPDGRTVLRAANGVPIPADKLAGWKDGAVDLAKMGFCRLYEDADGRLVLDNDLSMTSPKNTNSYLVNLEWGIVLSEMYGSKWRNNIYEVAYTKCGPIYDQYSGSRTRKRYYVGDLVMPVKAQYQVRRETARLLATQSAANAAMA